MEKQREEKKTHPLFINRRDFILGSIGACLGISALSLLKQPISQIINFKQAPPKKSLFPHKYIAHLNEINSRKIIPFHYLSHEMDGNYLIQLHKKATNGIGPHQNIVAFNILSIKNPVWNLKEGLLGNGSSENEVFYDLADHGKVVSGKSTADLSPLQLRLENKKIYTVGFF